ncbi:MAG: DUF4054 domain-containing protein, partial [Candidatus Accumulibacter sp.]|nr:DUF4054 domain-containing protein [Accumulibacter sp.]
NLTLSPDGFRARFPEFSDAEKYPDAIVSVFLFRSRNWLSVSSGGDDPYYLLAAHFLILSGMRAAGESQFGITTSASVGSVSVSVQAPQTKKAWQAWLAGTPYGQELWAWLSLKSAGGWSVGGLPERSAFRKVGGIFL